MSSRAYRAIALSIAVVCAASCSATDGVKKLPVADLSILRSDGVSVPLSVETASDDASRERGLMFRKTLEDGKGMLFVFESDRRLAFWMKDTLVPLSIAFLSSEGRILEIRDMESRSLAPVESERAARYALEVPQGWFARVGVRSGDTVKIPRPDAR